MKTVNFISFLLLIFFENLCAQGLLNHHDVLRRGIFVDYGLGNIAMRDEFISKEKYSGQMSKFTAGWSSFHKTYGYRLELDYQHSSKI
jgi:hypothetical protein